jgi:hypothetical protein
MDTVAEFCGWVPYLCTAPLMYLLSSQRESDEEQISANEFLYSVGGWFFNGSKDYIEMMIIVSSFFHFMHVS